MTEDREGLLPEPPPEDGLALDDVSEGVGGGDAGSADAGSAGQKAAARVGAFLKNNGYIGLAVLAAGGLMLFVWFCMGMIPFGGRTILRMDLYHQYGPLFAELYERLVGGRSLLYSWDTGLGGNFLGNFFNYLSSPTGLLVVLFGHDKIPEAIGVMILLKCAFASGAFAYFLRKVFGKSDAAVASFGVLYAFCGFFIAYYWNVMWIDAMALLPLVALGIHYIVDKRRFVFYTIALALTLVSNYYMGFMVCIFSVLYFLAQLLSQHEPATMIAQDAPLKQRKKFAGSVLAFGAGSILAGALAAFALLPVYFALQASSATGSAFPQGFETSFKIMDFLANHFADVEPTIRASGELVLPNVYSGVAAILLVPLYLLVPSQYIKPRQKAVNVLLLGLFFFSFNVRSLNFVWHAFHFPNDLPYRFSFLYSFLLLYIAYQAFLHLREIPVKAIVSVGALAVLFAVIVEKIGNANLHDITIYLTIAFIAAYTLLFVAVRHSGPKRASSLALLLFCCVITEVCAADAQNFEIDQVKSTYTADLKDFQWVKKQVMAEDDGFYRMELTDLRTRMDPAWYDYPGISTFSSMAYEKTSNLESRLGLGSNFINSYTYNPNTPVFNAMHNLKYLVENQNHNTPGLVGSSFLPVLNPLLYLRRPEFTRERFTVFENKYPLSVAYWTPEGVKDWQTANETNPFALQADYWERASGAADVFVPLDLELDEDYYGGGLTATLNDGYLSYSGKPAGEDGYVPMTLRVEQAQNAYIFVDSHYATVKVNRPDGRVEDRSHDTQAIWDLGQVTPEQPLSLEMKLSELNEAPESGSFHIYVYGLNTEQFTEGYFNLLAGAMNVTSHSDVALAGTVIAPADGLLSTSIPYDTGWKVTIDGKAVPPEDYVAIGDTEVKNAPAGGLLAVKIPAGEHKVEFKFSPQGFRWGLWITSGALFLLAVYGLIDEALAQRKTTGPKNDGPKKPKKPKKSKKKRDAEGELPPMPLFSTEGLSPEAFSLELAEEFAANDFAANDFAANDFAGDAPVIVPTFDMPPPPNNVIPFPQAVAAPASDQEEFSFFDDPLEYQPYEGAQPNAGPQQQSINSMLMEMQARAEELRRKMQMDKDGDKRDDGDDGPSFRLV